LPGLRKEEFTSDNRDPETSPTAIMQNVYGIYQSLAMVAGMELDVFTPLKDGPLDTETLATSLGVQAAKLSPLLYALVTAGLLTVADGKFANTAETRTFLVRGRSQYLGGLHGFYKKLWQATFNTAASIRTGQPQAKLDWQALPAAQLANYFQGQYPGSLRAGRELAGIIDFSRFKGLLDAGGGTGGVCIGICEAYPELAGTVADLPEVASLSSRFIDEARMAHRVKVSAADLTAKPPTGRYDAAVLRALLQVLPAAQAQKVLQNIYQALERGGEIFIVGSILEDSRLAPPASIGFSLVFLNLYDEGQSYTEKEHRQWLAAAGFTDISIQHNVTIDGLGLVRARKS
jgi:SAM-dependent methyltransferase